MMETKSPRDERIEQAKKELKIHKVPKVDISTFLQLKKEKPKMKIGVLGKKIEGLTSYSKGDMVLFTPYTVEESYGNMLWDDMEKYCNLCTIEVPSDRYFKKESRATTIKTIVGVPLDHIEYEIVVE